MCSPGPRWRSSLCWRSGDGLGTYVGDLEPLLGLYWRSWATLGAAVVCCTGPLLGPMLAVLAGHGANVDGQGPKNEKNIATLNIAHFLSGYTTYGLGVGIEALLGPVLAVLGRSWGRSGRSWAQVVGLRLGSGPKSGPNPSEKSFLERGLKLYVF